MKTVIIVAVVALGGAAWGWVFFGGSSVNEPIASFCRDSPEESRRVVQSWERAGLVRSKQPMRTGGLRVQVEDAMWAATIHDAKVSLGVAAYCSVMSPSGEGYVTIVGYRDGQQRAAIVNGHYSD